MNSITAAKIRRANPPPPPTLQNTIINKNQPSTQDNIENRNLPTSSLTLPQIIKSIDVRLITLEKTVTELKTNGANHISDKVSSENSSPNFEDVIDEFDKRCELLAQEIIELKDIVLKLQTFTMDVNKMLLEERNHIIDELEKKEQEKQKSPECNEG